MLREPKVGDLLSLNTTLFWNEQKPNSFEETGSQYYSMPIGPPAMPKHTPILVTDVYVRQGNVLKVVFLHGGSYYDVIAYAVEFMKNFDVVSETVE
jgi:hypothetical protein